MDAAFKKLIGNGVGWLPLLVVVMVSQDVCATQGWGDRSFDTTPYANTDRGWDSGNWIGSSGFNKIWHFGVTAESTDVGALVRQVDPSSSAARSGILPGDVIVCVAGDQVGRVGNQIFDLAEEINQHADSTGRIAMLMLDRRLGQLRSLNVQLDNQSSGLRGSLQFRGGRLPSDAVVTIRLENQTRPAYQVRNGETSFRLSNFGMGNVPFELNYDPTYIANSDIYLLRAFVTSGGRTILQTQNPPAVITRGNPTNVQLVLEPAMFGAGGGNFIQAGYVPTDSYRQTIAATYRRILGRLPSTMEMAAFERMPNLSQQVERLPVELMATEEFFTRTGGDSRNWVRVAFEEIVGQPPTLTELDLWNRRFAELGYSRTALLNQLAMQARG